MNIETRDGQTAMSKKRPPKLHRALGFWAMLAYGVGDIIRPTCVCSQPSRYSDVHLPKRRSAPSLVFGRHGDCKLGWFVFGSEFNQRSPVGDSFYG
jgi:hypothetical protein